MEDWQQRVVAEKVELELRLKNLRTFIAGPMYARLPAWHGALLQRQEAIMAELAQVLGERISRFGNVGGA